jgi:hypothetical protein
MTEYRGEGGKGKREKGKKKAQGYGVKGMN